jgi:hypothetical protein
VTTGLTRPPRREEGWREPKEVSVAEINANAEQLKALEVFKQLIREPESRRAYVTAEGSEAKEAAFNRRRDALPAGEGERLGNANYRELGEAVAFLEALSDSELAFFSDLDDAFCDAGLSVHASPGALMAH